MKQIILGTDEAGYGPNLGPLMVAVTAWEADLAETRSGGLTFLFDPLEREGIVIGDSKKLYHGGSMAALEASLLATFRSLNNNPALKSAVPIANDAEKIDQLAAGFETVLQLHQVRLLDMQYRAVEPEEFNQLLDRCSSKGALLSEATLRLIAGQLEKLPPGGDILILCDKHGGRNYYLDILSGFFPGEFIQVVQQSRLGSIYRLTSAHRRLEFRFLAKGESQLPIALASMLAKYQRELAMIQFNKFWQSHLPDLQPTAGYPEDAKRFKQQIAEVQKQLGITDTSLWRRK